MQKLKKYLSNDYIHLPIIVILFLLTCHLISMIFFDNDGYFILASGEYISNHGIPKINPFCIVENLKIIIQQSPWAVYCYQIYHNFVNMGLYISCVLLCVLNIFALYKLSKLKNVNTTFSILFLLFIFALNSVFCSIRPTMVTTFLLTLEIYILEKYKKENNKKILLFLILISFFEINMHAAIWIFHFVFILPYIVPPIKNPFIKFKEWNYHILPIILVTIPMFLVGFLNPYGLDGMLYLVYSFGDKLKNAGIKEMQPYNLNDIFGITIVVVTFIILFLISKKKELAVEPFYIFCGTTLMGFMYRRNQIYFFLGLICIVFELVSNFDFSKVKNFVTKQKSY